MGVVSVIRKWIDRYFSDHETPYLIVLIVALTFLMLTFGGYLAPVLAGLVFAFVLEAIVARLEKWRLPHFLAVLIAISVFAGLMVALLIWILPVVWSQLQEAASRLPGVVDRLNEILANLTTSYPTLLPAEISDTITGHLRDAFTYIGGNVAQTVLTQVPNLIAVIVFVVLFPICIFFFLKDKDQLLEWTKTLLPADRPVMTRIGREMTVQLTRYIRGKFVEILIVGSVTYVVFSILGLQYSELLALIVGLSVLIPFIGAAVVTIPVLAVAVLQFGWSIELFWVALAYGVIQALDGNLLVPLLFSEAVDLHPLAIIIAVLAFGGLWGMWGVFFAIPLAVLIKVVIEAWPRTASEEDSSA